MLRTLLALLAIALIAAAQPAIVIDLRAPRASDEWPMLFPGFSVSASEGHPPPHWIFPLEIKHLVLAKISGTYQLRVGIKNDGRTILRLRSSQSITLQIGPWELSDSEFMISKDYDPIVSPILHCDALDSELLCESAHNNISAGSGTPKKAPR